MPKPDEKIGEVGQFVIFRKSDSKEYEIVGPAAQHSPLSYTMVRVNLQTVDKIRDAIFRDVQRR